MLHLYKLGFFFITFPLCALLVHRKFTRREQIMLVHCTMLVRSIHWVFYIHIECTVEEREMERDAVHISLAFGVVQLWVTWLLNNVTHSQKKNKKAEKYFSPSPIWRKRNIFIRPMFLYISKCLQHWQLCCKWNSQQKSTCPSFNGRCMTLFFPPQYSSLFSLVCT